MYFGSDEKNARNDLCIPFFKCVIVSIGVFIYVFVTFQVADIFFLYKTIFYIFPSEMLGNGHCECRIPLPKLTGPFTYVHIKKILSTLQGKFT